MAIPQKLSGVSISITAQWQRSVTELYQAMYQIDTDANAYYIKFKYALQVCAVRGYAFILTIIEARTKHGNE